MADQIITITIPEEKVAIAVEGFLAIYPNVETKDDPEWVDPEDGSLAPQVAKYTIKAWVTEKLRRLLVRDVRRGLQIIANQNVIVEEDNSIAI
jgi:hypothetical protein